MSHRSLVSTVTLAISALLLVTPIVSAQKGGTPPRTPDGKPDLQGIWTNSTVTPLERPKGLGTKEFYTDQELAELTKRAKTAGNDVGEGIELGAARQNDLRYDLELYGFNRDNVRFSSKRTSLIVGPEGTIPPMLPEARQRNAARAAANKGHEFDSYKNRPLSERCIFEGQEGIPMLPAANEGNLLQIVQGSGHVALFHEIDHDTRVIPTDGRPHIPANIRELQGDSVGHWEGDTLVVDTTNFTNLTAFRGSSETLHLVERFTRTADDTLIYRFTVEDPSTWAKPWTAEVVWTKAKGPIYEYACHEGNMMISNILRGARVAEEEAAKKSGK